jgi:ribosomal protein S27E
MSTFDLVCAKCGLLTTVAEQGKAGLKYRCRGCGTILEVPGSEHTEVPGGGEIVASS